MSKKVGDFVKINNDTMLRDFKYISLEQFLYILNQINSPTKGVFQIKEEVGGEVSDGKHLYQKHWLTTATKQEIKRLNK